MFREVLLELAEDVHGNTELLGIVMNDSGVVCKFCSFLVLTELGHVLIDLVEVSLGFRQVVCLDGIVVSLRLSCIFASLVHHENGVITSFILGEEVARTHFATAIAGRIGFNDPVEHLGSVSMLAHFLVDESEVDVNLVFVPSRFLGITLEECFVSFNSLRILSLAAFDITFLGELSSLSVVVLRNVKHSATDGLFSILHRFRILLVLLVPRRVAVIALHNFVAVSLSIFELLLHDQDFDHGNIGERSVDVVRVDAHQALEGLDCFFVTVMVLVLHTNTVVDGVLESDLLVLQESFSFLNTTTFQVRECGSHEVHSFCAQVVRIFALVSTDDVIEVLLSGNFVFGSVIVRFCQVVHGKSRFLTREVFKASHLLIGTDSVLELTVHEVVFSNTEPCLRHKTVVREVPDKLHTELVSLVVFTTGFLHCGSLVNHGRSLRFLRILVDVFKEVAQGLLVIGLRELVDVSALCRLVITVSAPCDIFFVLGILVEEQLFFEQELVVTKLLQGACATVTDFALATFYLTFPFGNSVTHALFVKTARAASLFGLVLCNFIGAGALFIARVALSNGLALCKQFLSFVRFFFTRIRCSKRCSNHGANDC